MKVVFSSDSQSRAILRNKAALAQSRLKYISVKADQTPKQIENLKQLRAELQHRTESGETNLTIRYRKGVPTICNTEDNNQRFHK